MTERSFKSFKDASAFAKRMAKERKGVVRLIRHASEFIVQVTFSAGAPVHVKPEPERPSHDPKTHPADQPTPSSSRSIKSAAYDRLCVDCGVVIPHARVEATPSVSRCVKCQSTFEHTHDTRPRINEGLAGTRDENKKMRGQLWGDMRNRGRGR